MIYFDNSATTPPAPEVIEAVHESMKSCFGNPSSRHALGLAAAKELDSARRTAASAMAVRPDELYFTSGGTESDNISVFGAANIKKGRRLVTTAIEHPAVLRCFEHLEQAGFEVVYVKPHSDGSISEDDILNAVSRDTSLVSVMHVNNETGAIMPVERLKAAIADIAPRALLHVDAVQSFGHVLFYPSKWGIDLASVSSHKIHGPKGVGALYVKKGTALKGHVFGGGQEKNIRSGTENISGICGFAAACALLSENDAVRAAEIKSLLLNELLKIDGAVYNGGGNESPYIVNISFEKIRSEIMLNALSNEGICVSSGSACSSGSHGSHVLAAMGAKLADNAIRFSLSRYNTIEEAQQVCEAVNKIVKGLRR